MKIEESVYAVVDEAGEVENMIVLDDADVTKFKKLHRKTLRFEKANGKAAAIGKMLVGADFVDAVPVP